MAVSIDVPMEGIVLRVQGRADAVRTDENIVDLMEIKTTRCNPYEVCQDDYPVHWAQAQIYAYILCKQQTLDSAEVRLVYAGTKGGRQEFKREYSVETLEKLFYGYAEPYAKWAAAGDEWKEISQPSFLDLKFPFDNFRDGQREMADYIYSAMANGSRTLIEAPTGIGKTAASLYGAIKALGEGKITSVFYLTARTTGRQSAENALRLMRAKGLKIRSVTLTAKEKICFHRKADCAMCRYADGYYDRRKLALKRAMEIESITADVVEDLAREFEICPFELSLDITEIADVIICDYNYVFDPKVRLKRHFAKKSRAGLLIDEAHNLPDRGREMYSAALTGSEVERLRAKIGSIFGKEDSLYRMMTELLESLTMEDAEYDARREVPENVLLAAQNFAQRAESLHVSDEDTVELMYACSWFVRVAKQFDEDAYRVLIRPEGEKNRIEVRIWCFAPEKFFDRMFSRVGGAALFSATVTPIDFYASILAVHEKSACLRLESPFPEENLFVARIPVSVKFRDRSQSMEQVAQIIHATAAAHTGNYLACFPSHAYLMQAYKYYCTRFPGDRVVYQDARMDESRRAEFIAGFKTGAKESMVAFIVLGGVFAEGIDLPEEQLSGAVIVSTGIPLPNAETELLAELYDDGFEGGQDAAYTYPGFRRVLQAAGRVIRTENDRGVVLLLDARYASEKYQELYPNHWRMRKI
ncbi:MAG: ATP-dependent DNA helicase, partial [Clostridia bacterium]|nr:ATP-dependent DNA helicase [Clostridia bacterium]